MTFYENMVKQEISIHLKNHTIRVLHADGLYRHWRCQKPGDINMAFDVVTWPGSLCYTGDMGEYLFQHTEDMVAFMRGSCMSYAYAAEKCVAHDGQFKEWSEQEFDRVLAQRLEESTDDLDFPEVQEAIEEIRDAYEDFSSRFDAEKAMHQSNLWDGGDMPSCEVWTYHFLWCLHALKWFCERI